MAYVSFINTMSREKKIDLIRELRANRRAYFSWYRYIWESKYILDFGWFKLRTSIPHRIPMTKPLLTKENYDMASRLIIKLQKALRPIRVDRWE